MEKLRENNLKDNLREGNVLIGPYIKFTDPAAAEAIGYASFDFVVIDAKLGSVLI